MIKNKYDTSVIFLYAIGKENLLPAVASAVTEWNEKHRKHKGCCDSNNFCDHVVSGSG